MISIPPIINMDAIPGLSELPEKILTQCGLVTAISWIVILWLASQLAKAHAGRESDRASMLKVFNEQTAAYEKVSAAHAELKGMVVAIQMQRAAGHDDD